MSDKTTIQISQELKARLDKLGGKGDTYQEIIERLLAFYEQADKNARKRFIANLV